MSDPFADLIVADDDPFADLVDEAPFSSGAELRPGAVNLTGGANRKVAVPKFTPNQGQLGTTSDVYSAPRTGFGGGPPANRRQEAEALLYGVGDAATINHLPQVAGAMGMLAGQDYDETVARVRGYEAEYGRDQPGAMIAGGIVGSAPYAVLAPASAGGRVAAGLGAGGFAGSADDDPVGGMAVGGLGAAAGEVASRGVGAVGRYLSSPSRAASRSTMATIDVPYTAYADDVALGEAANVVRGFRGTSNIPGDELAFSPVQTLSRRRDVAAALQRSAETGFDEISRQVGRVNVAGVPMSFSDLVALKNGNPVLVPAGVAAHLTGAAVPAGEAAARMVQVYPNQIASRLTGRQAFNDNEVADIFVDELETIASANGLQAEFRHANRQYQTAKEVLGRTSSFAAEAQTGGPSNQALPRAVSPGGVVRSLVSQQQPAISSLPVQAGRGIKAGTLNLLSRVIGENPRFFGQYAAPLQTALRRGTLPATVWGLSQRDDFRQQLEAIEEAQGEQP